jgi:hypothetical protein
MFASMSAVKDILQSNYPVVLTPEKRHGLILLAKLIIIQLFTQFTILYAPTGNEYLFLAFGFAACFLNYYTVKDMISFLPYTGFIIAFGVSGILLNTALIYTGDLQLIDNRVPLWHASMWMLFACYYGDIFNKMLTFPLWAMSLLGAIGGSLGYRRGFSTSSDVVISDEFYLLIALFWAVYMPISLKVFLYFRQKKLSLSVKATA